MELYHVTTDKKKRRYASSKRILKPVRGFSTLLAALEWARVTGRNSVLRVEAYDPHKLPDHHNKYGEAWWNDGDILKWEEVFYAPYPITKQIIYDIKSQYDTKTCDLVRTK